MSSLWGIVLAGGTGSRLGKEAERRYGYPRPKQFCDFDGRGSLLSQTVDRALQIVPKHQIAVVTTQPWSGREAAQCLAPYPNVLHVPQPLGRDTGPGILLPLLRVLERDPDAIVVILPSDHHVSRPAPFAGAVGEAVEAVQNGDAGVVLLGAVPDEVEDGLGWIIPMDRSRCSPVRTFREKPPVREARRLLAAGAVVNTFVMVANGLDLAELCARYMPDWWRGLTRPRPDAVDVAYTDLPNANFSRLVLERAVDHLHVMSLGQVGWSDIGTPERLNRCLGLAIAAK